MEALLVEEAVVLHKVLLQQPLGKCRGLRCRPGQTDETLAQRRGRASLDIDSRHRVDDASVMNSRMTFRVYKLEMSP